MHHLKAGLDWAWVLLPGAVLAPLMGGALASLVRRFLAPSSGGMAQGGVVLPGIELRWPPALFSSHLGALALTSPGQLVLALIELGPLVLLAVPVTRAIPRALRSRKLLAAGLGLLAIASFLAPLVLQFVERERDITRLSGTALTLWSALGLPYAWLAYKKSGVVVKGLLAAGFFAAIFGGLALFPAQLVDMQQPQASYYIQETDVLMSRQFWGRLEPGAWVLDPAVPYRPAALFARTTGPAYENVYIIKPEFNRMLATLTPQSAAAAGYSYLYIDRETWSELPPDRKQLFQKGCVKLLGEQEDAMGDFRRLYDIQKCATTSTSP